VPKTIFQKIVFAFMMGPVMVYGMEVYNTAIIHGGLSYPLLILPLGEMLILSLIVVVIQMMAGEHLARRLAFRLVDPQTDRPILIILAMSVMTVCCMCPMMSLVATILFKGIDKQILVKWIQTTAINFPMALFWQLFIAGPLVRFLFRKLFAQQLDDAFCSSAA